MASDLPDALEKLALKQEQSENEASQSSLSKYFGQVDNGDDIFDTIAKPSRPDNSEPKVNFFKSPASTPVKEEVSRTNSVGKSTPSFAFKKCEDDEEPKVFSYFNQPEEAGKDSEATEFFDQISELTSKTHKPLEISSHPVVEQQVNSEAQFRPAFESSLQVEIPTHQLPGKAPSPLPIFTPHVTSPPALASTMDFSSEKVWSKVQERASGWWIPKDKTRRWLQQSSGSTVIPSSELTSPSISNNVEFADPIKQLLRHYDGETAAAGRQTLTADLVTQDDRGIKDLIKVGCWRAAANLCGRLLTSYGQGYGKVGQPPKHTHHTLQLWFTRLAMLVKSQLAEVAFNEALQFGDLDAPDLYFDYYPESGQRGTMVPFNFRLLVAELPAHQNQINRAQSRLCQVLATVRRILSDVDRFATVDGMNSPEERREVVELWTRRETQTIFALVNCALKKKDFHNAAQLLLRQLQRHPTSHPSLHSTLGRVYLQLGDVQKAQKAFNSASDLRNNGSPAEAVASFVDAGFVAVAQNAFAEAHGYFKQALLLDPDNPVLINNAAVCLLYTGSMRESMLMLEENLGTKPDSTIRDETVLNVCTLYELESSLTIQRKLGMLRLASQWRNDNLNIACFKLNQTKA